MRIKNILLITLLGFVLISTIFLVAYLALLSDRVEQKLDGVLWTVPAKVYSRPLELVEGYKVRPQYIEKELELLSYVERRNPTSPGEYFLSKNKLNIYIRGHENQRPGLFELSFSKGEIVNIKRSDGISVDLISIEPLSIGGIFPSHMQDRILLNWSQVPKELIEILVLVEDKKFFEHPGISIRSIFRALFRNVISFSKQEGGSTITQQLAKSLFFSPEKTYTRKVKEAFASLLIETNYSKQEILLAYINDVFVSQSGRRAIHGFELGAQHFFGTSLNNLDIDQISLLVGMLKGPSRYNPRRNPERAKERRDLVLGILKDSNLITRKEYDHYISKTIKVIKPSFRSQSKHPTFSDLVTIDLRNNFQDKDLRTRGLKVYTNMDPVIQLYLEESILDTKKDLVKKYGSELVDIQMAAIVIDSLSGEIQATVGSSNPRDFGFNRILNASRPIGSLIKPWIYLTALTDYKNYNLMTPLSDNLLEVEMPNGDVWTPKNFDKKFHGNVPLHRSLWQSYNIATARLGMSLGHDKVQSTLDSLKIENKLRGYPSEFIGSFELTPYEVIQSYQPIASKGFYSSLRAVREVTGPSGKFDLTFPHNIEQVLRPEPLHLLRFALMKTFEGGTARGYSKDKLESWAVGGKTGTSDDQRDSWFVGYAGEHLVLIWVGFDDNRKTPLTGRSGALEVWKSFMEKLNPLSNKTSIPERINYQWVDKDDGKLSGKRCKNSIIVPFINGTEPKDTPNIRKGCRTNKDVFSKDNLNYFLEAVNL